MIISPLIEEMSPRWIEGRDGFSRRVVVAYTTNINKAQKFKKVLRKLGVECFVYVRREYPQYVIQVSGKDVYILLTRYTWKTRYKRNIQKAMMEEIEYDNS